MKMLKLALLGGAAFAVTAASAQADELSDLKAQLEALQSRVAQIESQPAAPAAMPAGASLVMFKEGQAFADSTPTKPADRVRATDGFSIAVTPTADMPAPVAEVTVSGNIRTLLVYGDPDTPDDSGNDDFFDVQSRARLVVDGKTETAVGEVGGHIRLQGGDPVDGNTTAQMNEWWGYWQINEGWRLQAGRWDNTAAVQSGVDWDCTLCGYAQGGKGLFYNSAGITNGGTEQIRLTYTGGPLTWAVAVEDPANESFRANEVTVNGDFNFDGDVDDPGEVTFTTVSQSDESDVPDFASYVQYNGDGIMMMLTGVISDDEEHDSAGRIRDSYDDPNWFIGAGARFGLGEIAALSLAGGFGEGYARNSIITLATSDTEYWGVSALLTFNMNDTTRLEVQGGYSEADNTLSDMADSGIVAPDQQWLIGAGIYWDPVSQLTLGIQGDYSEWSFDDDVSDQQNQVNIAFGTWFRF